jgi:hypothetical protein
MKIAKNKIKHPTKTVLTIDINSSNLDLKNQCWYKPEKENRINQYK